MERLIRKVKKLLTERFKSAEIELEPLSSGTKITGTIVWKGFARFDELERQEMLWRLFDRALSQDERRKLSLIVTATPKEATIFQSA
jgi:hypothetical protein